MNVLLTGAGRRNFLVQFFQSALGSRGRVIACDLSASAPALAEAREGIVVPPMDDPQYFDVLVRICREKQIRLIVPVNDLEIAGLARNASRFREVGAVPLTPSEEVVAMCSDKWSAFKWLRRHGIPAPETFLTSESARTALKQGKAHFPLMMKPRWGTSSIGVEVVENERELELAYEWGKIQLRKTILAKLTHAKPDLAFLFQEHIEGSEYGIDIVNDLNGNYAATFARRKLAMRAGNTDRAISVVEPALEQLGSTLGHLLGHIASIDCDVMVRDQTCYVVDMNPRLGGGYPFSHMAGANLPAALIAWVEGTKPDLAWLRCRPGVLSSKYDGVIVTETAATASNTSIAGVAPEPEPIRKQLHH
jgi:carbamoyl-phosphate synthase large subunit